MGRPERHLDADDGPVAQFALELRRLRDKAGLPSYRRMASKAHFSHTALSEAAGGDRFPSLDVTLGYVRACEGDEAEWEKRWHATSRARSATEPSTPEPYVGLVPFEPEDAERFHGREELAEELATRVARTPLVLVIGPSGSGKSSLLRAGLVAAANAGRLPGDETWSTALLTPGRRPISELAGAVGPIDDATEALDIAVRQRLAAGSSTRMLLVVDQFEELFTVCADPAERDAFVATLLDAAFGAGRRTHVVLGVRADFYGHCLAHPPLLDTLRGDAGQVLVGAMTEAQLRRVILEPATRTGLSVEPELVATLVAEVAGKPGALPLVAHALRETWQRRNGSVLGMADYRATGGVSGALAQTAEQLHSSLSDAEQQACRRILLRLTALGEGTEDTRRRAERSEVDAVSEHGHATRVLHRLASARLVVLHDDTAELAHEAIVKAWPRLHRWLTDDRGSLLLHRELTTATASWEALGRDPGMLYRGARLAQAQEWAAEHDAEMTTSERDFLAEGVALARSELAATVRHNRRLRLLASALSILLVIAAGTGVFAWSQRQQAREQQRESASRQLAAQSLASAGTQVRAAATLAEQAYRTAPTVEARSAVLSLAGHQAYRMRLAGHAGTVASIAFGPDGRSLVSGGWDRTVLLWDISTGTQIAALDGHDRPVHAVAYSPDGKWLASGDAGGTVTVWDLARHVRVRTLPGLSTPVNGLEFNADGSRLAGSATTGPGMIWEVATGRRLTTWNILNDDFDIEAPAGFRALRAKAVPVNEQTPRIGLGSSMVDLETGDVISDNGDEEEEEEDYLDEGPEPGYAFAGTLDGEYTAHADSFEGVINIVQRKNRAHTMTVAVGDHTTPVRAVAFAPDGDRFVSADMAGSVYLWEVNGLARLSTLTGHLGGVTDVAVSADSGHYAASGEDGTILIWDRHPGPLVGHTGSVGSLAFGGPDGTLVTGSADAYVRIWDRVTGRARVVSPDEISPVTGVALNPGATVLATAAGARIHLWDPTTGSTTAVLAGAADTVTSVAFSPDGRVLAGGAADGSVALWDPVLRKRIGAGRVGGSVHTVAFSPDGRLLAAAGDDGRITLIEPTGGKTAGALDESPVNLDEVAFSPDGRLLASARGDGRVGLWDVAGRDRVALLDGHAGAVRAVAFSPDGKYLASAGLDGAIQIWDVPSRTRWATLTGHADGVAALSFSPDGATLASGSMDHTTILWPMHFPAAMSTVRSLAG